MNSVGAGRFQSDTGIGTRGAASALNVTWSLETNSSNPSLSWPRSIVACPVAQ